MPVEYVICKFVEREKFGNRCGKGKRGVGERVGGGLGFSEIKYKLDKGKVKRVKL